MPLGRYVMEKGPGSSWLQGKEFTEQDKVSKLLNHVAGYDAAVHCFKTGDYTFAGLNLFPSTGTCFVYADIPIFDDAIGGQQISARYEDSLHTLCEALSKREFEIYERASEASPAGAAK